MHGEDRRGAGNNSVRPSAIATLTGALETVNALVAAGSVVMPDVEEISGVIKENIPTITAGTRGTWEGAGSWLSGIRIRCCNLSALGIRALAD